MIDTILKLLREEHRVIKNLIHQIETSREISQKKEFYLVLRETFAQCAKTKRNCSLTMVLV